MVLWPIDEISDASKMQSPEHWIKKTPNPVNSIERQLNEFPHAILQSLNTCVCVCALLGNVESNFVSHWKIETVQYRNHMPIKISRLTVPHRFGSVPNRIEWQCIRYIRSITTAHRHDRDNLSVSQIEGIKAMKFNNNDANHPMKWRITILCYTHLGLDAFKWWCN